VLFAQLLDLCASTIQINVIMPLLALSALAGGIVVENYVVITVINYDGSIPKTHGGKPNPPLSQSEKKQLKEWGEMNESVVKPMKLVANALLEAAASRISPGAGRISSIIAIALLFSEILIAIVDQPSKDSRRGFNGLARTRWLDNEDGALLRG
jgi:hypothetical protein